MGGEVIRLAAAKCWLYSAIAAGALVASISPSEAQVIPTMQEIVMPPWNAQQIFAPTILPQLTDPDTREDVAPEDTPVKNRATPEYMTRGIRTGDWIFNPELTAGEFYDSNVFSSNSNIQSDVATQTSAGLRARSLWERHGIDMQASAQSVIYRNHSGLNQTDVTFKGSGRFDIDHSTVLLGSFNAGYLHEGVGTLSSPAGAVEPTPYTLFSTDLTLRKEFGRFTVSAGTGVASYSFGSTRGQDGSIINQSARDGQIYTSHARIDYAFSEKFAYFTSVEGNWRKLRGTIDSSLDSNGYRALVGFNLEFTRLINGEIAAGYLGQHFFASSIGNIAGPAYRAMLTWSPSRLVDVHFKAEQVVTESSDTSTTGILANAMQAGVDYEFRPNVVLSTAVTFEKDHFKAQSHDDNVYAVDAQVKYLLNNTYSVALQYRYTHRNSSIPEFSFDKHQVGINAAAHF
jgi:hypothetical protein